MMSAFFYLQAALNRLFNSCQKQSSGGVLCRKGVIRNFAKFLGEHLCQSLFFNKVAGLGLQLYKKRDTSTGVVFL